MNREYPFKAFVLTPAMLVKAVEISGKYGFWGGQTYHNSAGGKAYPDSQLYNSPAEAIAAGRAQLAKQRADLDKKLANIKKREANLAKAEATL